MAYDRNKELQEAYESRQLELTEMFMDDPDKALSAVAYTLARADIGDNLDPSDMSFVMANTFHALKAGKDIGVKEDDE